MWAAIGGHREVFELLVSKGAKELHADRFGLNILQAACLGGNVNLVKYVLSQNTRDIDTRMSCWKTPLMLAAENGHKNVVELLVDKGADVSLKDETGGNVLHIACYGGHLDVVKYLLSLNSIKINRKGWKKMTPIMVAANQGHKEVVELLVKRGAKLSFRAQMGNILHTACHPPRLTRARTTQFHQRQ
ncbi:protein fem-1 homolog B-like [Haliotis asinina]|uniref:protein fem-1 homolog B-like n=1 Tax=Haliotis asinina TaxID=109174 RepID=UPI0035322D07